ncbi:hypothetical protein AI19_09340 [Thalassolituus oleivorans 4BN06-13]|nr:hypothetical protein [Thalassolituus oleivorans 4BN06-13]PCI46458.1 MAG: hypothetical protein COB43_14090 [Oceanospirillales bacterium]
MSMVSIKRRQLAYKLGSKADTRQFVPFSKTTNGDHGRKVFIDAALAPLFASLIDPNSAKGVQTIMKIEQLRAIAGGVTSNSNVNTPFEYMENFVDLALYYQIHNGVAEAGNSAVPGVYITDITFAGKETNSPAALYESKSVGPQLITNLVENDIAEMSEGVVYADESLPVAALNASKITGKDGWGNSVNFNLFYIPDMVRNEMGVWMTPCRRAFRPQEAAQHFANTLVRTQQSRPSTSPIKWTIDSDGTKLLQLALEHVPGILDKHQFQLTDPVGDVVQVINLLERKGAKFAQEPVLYSKTNKRALATAALSLRNGSLSRHQSFLEDKLRDNIVNSSYGSVQNNSLPSKVGGDFLTYMKNLSGAVSW